MCCLYGFKKLNSVNEVRKYMFVQKYVNNCSTLNLSTLSPCEQNLQQHIKPANYVAAMNKRSKFLMSLVDSIQHGWNDKQTPEWYNVVFRDDVSEILFDDDDTVTSDDDSSVDSFSDDEDRDSDDIVTE